MLGTQDPIRNALRDLVRKRRIWAWNVRPTHHGDDEWTVVTTEHRATLYSTDAVNKLIHALDAAVKHYPPRKEGPHTGWSPTRDRAAQRRFRAHLVARSGGQCEYVHPSGKRCDWPGEQAHHDKPGYGPDSGRFLCQYHHRQVDTHAR
jgi:hypothetical protein